MLVNVTSIRLRSLWGYFPLTYNAMKIVRQIKSQPGFVRMKNTGIGYDHYTLSLSGYNLYLKTYRSGFDARNVIDQVIFNTAFPRSVLYSLNQLQRYFDRLKTDVDPVSYKHIDFMIGKLRSKIQYSNLESVSEVGLHNYLVDINEDLQEIGNALNRYYFAYN